MDFYIMCVLILLAAFSSNICGARHHRYKKPHHETAFCFSDEELNRTPSQVLDHSVAHKMRWEKYVAVNLVPELEDIENRRKRRKRNPVAGCPQFNLLRKSEVLQDRSISPWSYRIDTDENRYPPKLAFAHCLCDHCYNVDTGKETTNLNSVLIRQNMLVLRKKTCPHDTSLWTFGLEYLNVPVGCTCSVPRYTSFP